VRSRVAWCHWVCRELYKMTQGGFLLMQSWISFLADVNFRFCTCQCLSFMERFRGMLANWHLFAPRCMFYLMFLYNLEYIYIHIY
jgi:hypothetical protein